MYYLQNSTPDELNRHLRTVIVAPMTTAQKMYPYRINCALAGKSGSIALDQIRTIDKIRIGDYAGKLNTSEIEAVKATLLEMFC
jgi:mRNA interferase MazF